MANRKVRVGQKFYFVPVLIDRISKPYNVEEGDLVTVTNLHGCPKANTMGHCYVMHHDGGFGGLVCTNSLVTREEYIAYLKMKISEHERVAA